MARCIANTEQIGDRLAELADHVRRDSPELAALALIGIQRRGVELAARVADRMHAATGVEVDRGILDITFYRDDLSMVAQQPIVHGTDIRISLEQRDVILVDDVIFTGRTIRAALDALVDFGRARTVRLLILVDRGHRELPIQPDYVGWRVQTARGDQIRVKVRELDGEDCIELIEQV
jgi:pyrimidine operon attenuation protein/uracil phosphoribosyltransferase